MSCIKPNFGLNSVIDYVQSPNASPRTLIVTRISETAEGTKITGWDWKEMASFSAYYLPHNTSQFTINEAEQKLLPKKGDCVTFAEEGIEIRGIIASLKKGKFEIIFEGFASPISVAYGTFSVCRPKFKDNSDKNSIMAKWKVSSYGEMPGLTEETVAFSANIKLCNKNTLHVLNSGHGGPDIVNLVPRMPKANYDAFLGNCKKWHEQYSGEKNGLEPHSDWIRYEVMYRPFGYTEADYFKKTASSN